MTTSAHRATALVTGASAGLGREFCRRLAETCEVLIAVARRSERLEELAGELGDRAEVHCLGADLSTVEGTTVVLEAMRQHGPVDYLVNNAGFGTFGRFDALDIAVQRDMLNLHLDATTTLCRAAIPFMRELGGGYIINVSSVGAFMPGKHLAVYGATKAFLNYFSLALQEELDGTGIHVQSLCPGFIRTEFHDGMSAQGFERRRVPDAMWMDPGEIVAQSLAALDSGRVVVVPGEDNRALVRTALQSQMTLFDR